MESNNTLSFSNIELFVKRIHKKPLYILKNVTGCFHEGVNAIMGPSGSGKSSLLNLLSSRNIVSGKVKGDIYFNNQPVSHNFKNLSGYVVQENILVATMTVKENIMFSASLRLAATNKERVNKVETIINELKLNKCANTRVGSNYSHGISGGQKRRCSIAMELVTNPKVLFLDEPTSGLDASTAINVTILLKRLARKGCTVIMSIHQPRYGIFKLFDKLLLLSEGNVVYQGPPNDALNYFQNLGYECGIHENPADFFLDIIEENFAECKVDRDYADEPSNDDNDLDNENNVHNYVANRVKKTDLVEGYQQSEYYTKVMDCVNRDMMPSDRSHHKSDISLKQLHTSNNAQTIDNSNDAVLFLNGSKHNSLPRQNGVANKKHKIRQVMQQLNSCNTNKSNFRTTFFHQLGVVTKRTMTNYVRNPQIIISHAIIMFAYSFVLGGIYFRTGKSLRYGIQNRTGALYFILMNEVFISLSVLDIFIQERANFLYEVSNGFYRVSVYFIAKIMADLLIMKSISIIILSTVAYWMIGFKPEISAFFIFMLTVFMLSASATSVAMLGSTLFKNGTVANNMCSLFFVFMMTFGGYFVNLTSLHYLIRWIRYISIFMYALNAFLINELKGLTFCKVNKQIMLTNVTMNQNNCTTGDAYLDSQGIAHSDPWDLWKNYVALAGITFVFWFASYIRLRRIKRN